MFRKPKKYKDIHGDVQKALGIQGYIIRIASESPRNTRIYMDKFRKPYEYKDIYINSFREPKKYKNMHG